MKRRNRNCIIPTLTVIYGILFSVLSPTATADGSLTFCDNTSVSGQNPVFPIILGHEARGVVESVGEGVNDLQPGDHVLPVFTGEFKECAHSQSSIYGMRELHLEVYVKLNKMEYKMAVDVNHQDASVDDAKNTPSLTNGHHASTQQVEKRLSLRLKRTIQKPKKLRQ